MNKTPRTCRWMLDPRPYSSRPRRQLIVKAPQGNREAVRDKRVKCRMHCESLTRSAGDCDGAGGDRAQALGEARPRCTEVRRSDVIAQDLRFQTVKGGAQRAASFTLGRQRHPPQEWRRVRGATPRISAVTAVESKALTSAPPRSRPL